VVDGWEVAGFPHDRFPDPIMFDLLVVCSGTLNPVKKFEDCSYGEWVLGILGNMLEPLNVLHGLSRFAKPGATVVFFSGPNPNKLNPYYSSYSVAKAGLFRAVQEINGEVDCKVVMLAPGFVDTKIHEATRKAGIRNERLEQGGGTDKEKIYKCLRWVHEQPKEKVGGQFIYVPEWDERI
jgi:NAD(P)-dependent dehydrogenase (short-subunit alcohol dehydrogenase family)